MPEPRPVRPDAGPEAPVRSPRFARDLGLGDDDEWTRTARQGPKRRVGRLGPARERPDGKLWWYLEGSRPPRRRRKTHHDHRDRPGVVGGVGGRGIALREQSIGAGRSAKKGGGTGGGPVEVVPSTRSTCTYTGDFHAITSRTNLLARRSDNHVHHATRSAIDVRQVCVEADPRRNDHRALPMS